MTNALTRYTDAGTDAELIDLWLHTGRRRSERTREAYRLDVRQFFDYAGRPLQQVKVDDLAGYKQQLMASDYATTTVSRKLAAVKSLLSFAQKTGYLPVNVGTAIELPAAENTLAERLLTESDVMRMILSEPSERNQALLALLYYAGLRVSELCSLQWRHVKERPEKETGQLSIFGKGDKARTVLLNRKAWNTLAGLYDNEESTEPVFRSREGGALHRSQVYRIVRAAAERAGVEGNVSPHWLRHAHATHALERGAPIPLVRDTLGHKDERTTGKYLHARPDTSSAEYLA